VTRETLSTEAKVDIIINCESTAREQLATATPRHFAPRVSAMTWWGVAWPRRTIMRAVYSHPDAVAMASAGRTLSDVLGGNR